MLLPAKVVGALLFCISGVRAIFIALPCLDRNNILLHITFG